MSDTKVKMKTPLTLLIEFIDGKTEIIMNDDVKNTLMEISQKATEMLPHEKKHFLNAYAMGAEAGGEWVGNTCGPGPQPDEPNPETFFENTYLQKS